MTAILTNSGLTKGLLTADRLREVLEYCPERGLLRWKNTKDHRTELAGGHINRTGYSQIIVDHRNCLAHRVVWAVFYGQWPSKAIDHINGIKTDNRIENLRLASGSENMWNRGISRNNTSGVKGVYWNRNAGKWEARVKSHRRDHYLGLFSSIEEAKAAYDVACLRLHGSFALPNSALEISHAP